MSYKVCVYAICKNEEKFADRWMDSMGEADLVVVTDTGSSDATVLKLRARGAVVHEETVEPWRFDAARNISLAHAPDDADICVCTDLDEVFAPGWRAALEGAWRGGAMQVQYLYNWSLRPDGSPDVQFTYSKIHARRGFIWRCPVHEYLEYTGKNPLNTVFMEGITLNHFPDGAKSRGSYLPLLETAVREEPENERMLYYLGREYMYKSMWKSCIKTLFRHLKISNWAEERCASMRWIAKSFLNLGDFAQSDIWYYRAIAELPSMREPYVEFALAAYSRKNWPLCYFLAKESLKIAEKSRAYINMGYAWDHTPDDLCAIACYNIGLFESAFLHAKNALDFTPTDKRLAENLSIIESRAHGI